ncbi:MAG TPA: hypothetical protein VNA89_00395 [Gemmatimonadaceae bacterium]|nr:hypothetical protein [Gemmatimonadaceae bacterium]
MRTCLMLALTALVPAVLGAQDARFVVDSGMTKAQVVERLGAPASERSAGAYTYLYYFNGCERECGMSDLVILQNDAVVDAIFRASERQYTGQSSSPAQRRPQRSVGGVLRTPLPASAPAVRGDDEQEVEQTAPATVIEVEVRPGTEAAKPALADSVPRPDSVQRAVPRIDPDSTATPPEARRE